MPDIESADVSSMPSGAAESASTIWAAAEAGAAALEGKLVAEGKAPPGSDEVDPELARDVAELEAKPKPVPSKGKPIELSDKSAELKRLEELATKLGMKVDANRVEVAERVKLREERRAFREAMQRETAAHQARVAEDTGKLSSAKVTAFEKASESGDFDGMAKAAGFADWKAMLNEQTKRMASPEYREIQELKKRDAEREQRDKAIEQQRAEQEQRQVHSQRLSAYKAAMADELKGHGGQLERMASDPDIVEILYQARAEHYNATGDELELNEVVETPARMLGGKTPLDLLRSKWEALSAIFGDRPADLDEGSKEPTRRSGQSPRSKEPTRAPKTVSQRNAAEASAPPEFKSEAEYKRYFSELLNQSTHTSG